MMNENFWSDYESEVRDFLPNKTRNTAVFYRDGIVCQEKYDNKKFRPLFILKEVYDKTNGCAGCDYECCGVEFEDRTTIRTINLCNCKDMQECVRMYQTVATLTDKLQKVVCGKEIDALSIPKKDAKEAIKLAAVINLKKIGAGNAARSKKSASSLYYQRHACKFSKELKEQIEEIQPTLIICGGTFEVFRTQMGVDCEKIKQTDKGCVRALYKCSVEANEFLVLDMRHPSNGFSFELFVEGIDSLKDNLKG